MAESTELKIATSQTEQELTKSDIPSEELEEGSDTGLNVSHKVLNETGIVSKTSAEEIDSLEAMLKLKLGSMKSGTETSGSATMSNSPARSIACPGEWVRPLGYLETFMAVGGHYGTLNTVQGLWLSSTQPILPEEVRQALTLVAQQTDVMQLCVQWRRLWPWFRRIKGLLAPFKVERDDVMSVYYKILGMPYEMSHGPLWRARLVPLPQRSPGRYEAVLMIAAHHCITDGVTNMVLCRETLEVLNAIMSGRQHNVTPRQVIPNIAEEQVTMQDWLFSLKTFCSKVYSFLFTNYSTNLHFNGALQQPATRLVKTKVLRNKYTVETTRLLIQRCKTLGVAVDSCILAAAYLAMLSVFQEFSKKRLDEALINGVNCFNMRRYYPQKYEDSPGCHTSLVEQELLVRTRDTSSKENFLCLVIRLNSRLKSLVVDKIPITNSPLFSTLMLHINLLVTSLGRQHRTDSHFVISNMGNLRDLLPGKYGDGPVEITNLLRSVSTELMDHPFNISFHTFLERLMISMDYTTKVTNVVAHTFFCTFANYITNIAHFGNVLMD